MKKKYPVIEVPSDGNPNWFDGARCMVFVYSKHNGNFILKGYLRETLKYLKENYQYYFYYISMWHKGKSRGYWKFWKNNVYIISPNKSRKEFKYKIGYFSKEKFSKQLRLKRIPKKWIPEFNQF